MNTDIIDKHRRECCVGRGNLKACAKDKEETIAAGKLVRAQLKTKGWTLMVYENLGWHWILRNGYMSLDSCEPLHSTPTYHVMIGDAPGVGEVYWDTDRWFSNPNDAIEDTLRAAEQFVDRVTYVVKTSRAGLKK